MSQPISVQDIVHAHARLRINGVAMQCNAIFRSEKQRKIGFSFAFCSLIRTFARIFR